MFAPEAEVWYENADFDLLAKNITVGGFSPLFPDAHCTADGDICQLTTGESEINAATTIASLVRSPYFDLTTTYFMVAGIAGVNPEVATTGSVTFARYAVQVALQYEFSQFEIPTNYTSGYIPLGSYSADQYPQSIYGTEVFELNTNLQKMAATWARKASLNDSEAAMIYRANYAASEAYTAGASAPSVVECDVATSDVYYSGTILSTAFGNYTTLMTNGTGNYCTTAQEDNATLEAMLRAAVDKLVDFSRIIVCRCRFASAQTDADMCCVGHAHRLRLRSPVAWRGCDHEPVLLPSGWLRASDPEHLPCRHRSCPRHPWWVELHVR